MFVSIRYTQARMQMLFIVYRSLLKKNGIKWILESSQKLAVTLVLDFIKPHQLRLQIQEDLEGGYLYLKNGFSEFMQHALETCEAFDKIYLGGKHVCPEKQDKSSSKPNSKTSLQPSKHQPASGNSKKPRVSLLCLFLKRVTEKAHHL